MVYFPSEFMPEYRPSRKYSIFSTKGWWLNRWPPLAWLETFVKIGAWLLVPFIPLNGPASEQDIGRYVKPRVTDSFATETIIMLIASVLLAFAVIDRLVYREIISMIFVFPNNWAHWTVALEMYRRGRAGINVKYFRGFCWLMLTGDVVKLVLFAVHDFSRLNIARYVLYVLVGCFAALYAIILLLDYGYNPCRVTKLFDAPRLSLALRRICG